MGHRLPRIQFVFEGRKLCHLSQKPSCIPPLILGGRKELRWITKGRSVTAAFYNSGKHVYWQWDRTWPRQYERWEQQLMWLRYQQFPRKRLRGEKLPNCVVWHDGHRWTRRNGARIARLRVHTFHGNAWTLYLVPDRMYYIVHFGDGCEAVFMTDDTVTMPKELLLGDE